MRWIHLFHFQSKRGIAATSHRKFRCTVVTSRANVLGDKKNSLSVAQKHNLRLYNKIALLTFRERTKLAVGLTSIPERFFSLQVPTFIPLVALINFIDHKWTLWILCVFIKFNVKRNCRDLERNYYCYSALCNPEYLL